MGLGGYSGDCDSVAENVYSEWDACYRICILGGSADCGSCMKIRGGAMFYIIDVLAIE